MVIKIVSTAQYIPEPQQHKALPGHLESPFLQCDSSCMPDHNAAPKNTDQPFSLSEVQVPQVDI